MRSQLTIAVNGGRSPLHIAKWFSSVRFTALVSLRSLAIAPTTTTETPNCNQHAHCTHPLTPPQFSFETFKLFA
ncbi:MAG: hypothetical protein HC769_32290 [Cyanobacteria bacterium CRU_2_1]|nr:hypothetical protein [Cyanobacteria bacterium CRU_2_1]